MSNSTCLRLGALGAMLLASFTALGESSGISDLSLEDLLNVEVEGASRFQQPLSEAPASVTVISSQDIRRYGYRTVAEALESAPGVYANDDRDYTYLGLRGFNRSGDYNSRILLLNDGLRRNEPLYQQAMVGSESPIEMEWVKQLEFIPGPASALYGGNALFGVANAVLWSGADLNGSRVNAEFGNHGLARLGVLSGRSGDGLDWVAGITVQQKRGEDFRYREFEAPGISDGVAHRLDGERYLKAFTRLIAGEWQVEAGYMTRRKSVPTAYYGTRFDTPGNYSVDSLGYADVIRSWTAGTDWSHTLRFSMGDSRFEGQYVYPGLTNRDRAESRWLDAEYRVAYAGFKGHRMLLGIEGGSAPRLLQRNYDVSPGFVHYAEDREANHASLYAQDLWELSSRWTASLGLRADRMDDFGTVASPRAALIFHPAADAWVKLIHGRAFRPPNNYERFYNDGNLSQKANPGLVPERITSNELALELPLAHGLRAGGSLYWYRLSNLVSQVTDPVDGLAQFENSPSLGAHGAELRAEGILAGKVSIKGSMAWQHLKQHDGPPVNSPQRLAKLMIDGPLAGTAWSFGLKLQAISARTTLSGAVPGFITGNLALTHPLPDRRGQFRIGIYNLSGRHSLDPSPPLMTQDALPREGRQFVVSTEFNF